jgi:tRNA(Ile)-lysidine synthase
MINTTALHAHMKKLINELMVEQPSHPLPAPILRDGANMPPQDERAWIAVTPEPVESPAHPEEAQSAVSKGLERPPKLVIGLSGGADSVFLLHHLVELRKTMPLELIAAHLQHDWRGPADTADANFCKALAARLDVTFVTKEAKETTPTKKWNGSQEELGRNQRRAFLEEVRSQHAAHGIVLGHQAQDQEENFFIRLLRGASLEGLCGMQAREKFIIRPMLTTQREDIERWLVGEGQRWCHDIDNENRRFLRNRIRHELLPLFHSIDQRADQTFARTLLQLQQEQELINDLVTSSFAMIFDSHGNGDLAQFKQLHPMLQGHVLKKLFISVEVYFTLSEGFIDEALRFLNSPRGGSHQLDKSWALTKKGPHFWITLQ